MNTQVRIQLYAAFPPPGTNVAQQQHCDVTDAIHTHTTMEMTESIVFLILGIWLVLTSFLVSREIMWNFM